MVAHKFEKKERKSDAIPAGFWSNTGSSPPYITSCSSELRAVKFDAAVPVDVSEDGFRENKKPTKCGKAKSGCCSQYSNVHVIENAHSPKYNQITKYHLKCNTVVSVSNFVSINKQYECIRK
jgi:hypothetical protein